MNGDDLIYQCQGCSYPKTYIDSFFKDIKYLKLIKYYEMISSLKKNKKNKQTINPKHTHTHTTLPPPSPKKGFFREVWGF